MLETIRELSVEHPTASNVDIELERRHGRYFLDVARARVRAAHRRKFLAAN